MADPNEQKPGESVVFDVIFEDGLLFFEISNRATVSVANVVAVFHKPMLAPDGVTDLTSLRIFKGISFLAPGKAIRVFVDSVPSYFARRQPNIVHVVMTWREEREIVSRKIAHDLRIYRDLPYIVGQGEPARRGVPFTNQAS